MGLVELAKLKGLTKKQITYLATLNPLPPVALKSGFDRVTFFYNKDELLKWFDETKPKRGTTHGKLETQATTTSGET